MASISPEQRTLPKIVKRASELYGQKVAIQEADVRITFADLESLSLQAAKSFIAADIRKGDRVAIWAPNIYEWVIAAVGLQTVGGVLVPLNTRMKGSEAADIINRSGAKLLLTIPEFQAGPGTTIDYLALLADQDIPELQRKILLRGEAKGVVSWAQFINSGNSVSEQKLAERSSEVKPEDTMDMLFTSGTTGKPKGVICNHGQNIEAFQVWSDTVGLRSDDNYLVINPFFHSFGYKAGWLAGIITGAKILPVLTFDIDAVLKQIEQDKVSMLPGPPTIYQSILAHPDRDKYDLSSLRLAVTGAASVPVELIKKMRSELNFETVVTAYGLTESCGVVTICRPDDDPETIATTAGCAIPGVEVKCVGDAAGTEVKRGEPGEIWLRGYNVMQGYFDNPQATAETITADGWMKTGDIGVMDERGYIRITDRIKDMYISGGFNVYPAEIENGLSSIAGVVQAAVIGVPDERMGEVGKAYIVKAAGADLTAEEVIDWCRSHMANYKVPRSVEFIDAMPLNASGKVLKPTLRQMAAG
jgi:acyl-CoA synthetase (AMP-forming)/AMP-acid ligase II